MVGTIVSVQATLNGQTYNLTKGSGNTWTASPTAPTQTSGSNNGGQGPGVGANARGKGYYPVTITATDDFGNTVTVNTDDTTWANALKLKVLERTAPSATLTYPSSGAYIKTSRPEIKFTVTDSGSGIKSTECYVVIDTGSPQRAVCTVSGSTGTATFTPSTNLSDGPHNIKVYGYDYDGNKSNESSGSFIIDTQPPVLNITSPSAETTKTNQTTISVSGTTNDGA